MVMFKKKSILNSSVQVKGGKLHSDRRQLPLGGLHHKKLALEDHDYATPVPVTGKDYT